MWPRFAVFLVVAMFTSGVSAQSRFFSELFAPADHTHFSPLGAPYLHPFTMEPPQMHQDVFFIYRYANNTFEGSDENEAEAHIDWALSKRFGIFLGLPMIGIEEAGGTHQQGLGDLEIGPRTVLIERDRFILSSNFFMTMPTGDASRDLGAGEMELAPLFTTWQDLGNWNSLYLNFGPRVGTETGNSAMIYGFSYAKAFLGPVLPCNHENGHGHGEEDGVHFPPGLTAVYLELAGESEMNGAERTFIEMLPGISYAVTEHAEVRFGLLVPVSRLERFDTQYIISFTWVN